MKRWISTTKITYSSKFLIQFLSHRSLRHQKSPRTCIIQTRLSKTTHNKPSHPRRQQRHQRHPYSSVPYNHWYLHQGRSLLPPSLNPPALCLRRTQHLLHPSLPSAQHLQHLYQPSLPLAQPLQHLLHPSLSVDDACTTRATTRGLRCTASLLVNSTSLPSSRLLILVQYRLQSFYQTVTMRILLFASDMLISLSLPN